MSRQPEAGFTLAEVVIAAGILAVGMIAVSALFAMAVSADRASLERTLAAAAARQKLEEIAASFALAGAAAAGYDTVSSGRFVRRWQTRLADGGLAVVVDVDVSRQVAEQSSAPLVRLTTFRRRALP